ncbi:MAG: transcription elongation factor Spt5 [Thermoplasmata archaeon]|jgi:transcriptional antiterminator NusG
MEENKREIIFECQKKDFKISAGRYAEIPINITAKVSEPTVFDLSIKFEFNVKDNELEWIVTSEGIANKKYKIEELNEMVIPSKVKNITTKLILNPDKNYAFTIKVQTPKGSSMGDKANIFFELSSETIPFDISACQVKIELVATIVAIKTQIGKEVEIARDLGNRIRQNNIDYVYSIMVPGETSRLTGYVFLETIYPDRVLSFIKDMRGIKGVVKGEMNTDEILHYLAPKPAVESLSVGNFVELTDGPFKGEKGRIIQIDMENDKIVVELTDSLVPIPITVKAASVRVLDKE